MIKIKDWFISKNFTVQQRQALTTCYEYVVIGETEKAYKILADTDFGNIKFWCPKSCTISEEEQEHERIATEEIINKYHLSAEDTEVMWRNIDAYATGRITEEQFKEALDKKNSGLEYNNRLVEFCKMAGIKVTNRRYTTAKLIEKIQNAGLEVPAR